MVTLVASLLSVAVAGLIAATLDSTPTPTAELPIPNGISYAYHVAAGTMINRLGVSPQSAAIQWVKAAAHARSQDQLSNAAQGIADARRRDKGVSFAYFDTTVCAMIRHGSPSTTTAVQESGLHCSLTVLNPVLVPEGTPIFYDSRPPIGGPHYRSAYPQYGVVDHAVLPGYWLNNLEHGAVVLLYNCPTACPDLVAGIRDLYQQLPLGENETSGVPRLLAVPYTEMDHRLAVVAWDHLLELDAFDKDQILDFYKRFLDRGPECENLSCP